MKRRGSIEFAKVGDKQLWFCERLTQGLEVDWFGHLYLSKNTTRYICREASGITDGEGIRALDSNFPGFASIEVLHALDLGKRDEVAILESMTRFIEASDQCFLVLVDGDNHAREWLFAGGVDTDKLFTEIIEYGAEQTTGVCRNEMSAFIVRPVIDFQLFGECSASEDDNLEILDEVDGNLLARLSAQIPDWHVCVEFGETGDGHISARATNVFLSQEKLMVQTSGQHWVRCGRSGANLCGEIRDLDGLGIVDGD